MTRSSPLTVGLLWHSLSSGNLGVGALTESHIAILCRLADGLGQRLRIVVLGTGRAMPPGLQAELAASGHELVNQPVRVLRGSFRTQVAACDLVLDIGEGDSFATIYGFKRFFFYWYSKNRVCGAGTPLVLSPQTIGPFDSALTRAMARQVMRRCVRVFARDDLSRRYLSELGLDAVAADAIDVAFALPFERPARTAGGPLKLGLNVSGLLFSGGYTGNNQFGLTLDYAALMRRLLGEWTQRPGAEVHLVSHVIEPGRDVEDDMAAARQLAAEFPGVVVAPAFTRPSEAKSYIAGLDFFTGARMHACIAAFSSGVPVVPMAYSRKFNGLFGTLGYTRLVDCKADDESTAMHKLTAGLADIDAVRAEVATALQSVRERLQRYEHCLQEQLLAAAARPARS